MSELIRLQKIIADRGLASRRKAEEWIKEGRVTVNGVSAELGQKADPSRDTIKVGRKVLPKGNNVERIVLAMNKPKGYICSHSDPYHNKTIYDLIPKQYAKVPFKCAGRLDKESEGLLILTNDGSLINKITHPRNSVIKRYRVTLSKPFNLKLIPKLTKGITDEGEHLYISKIIPSKSAPERLEVHLEQGRKREIRRIFEAFGYFVERLRRYQIGSYTLKNIPSGGIKKLNVKDLSLLTSKKVLS